MIILDTCIFEELQRPKPNANLVDWLNNQDPTNLYITAITVGELLFGAYAFAKDERQTWLSDTVAEIIETDFSGRVLPYDATAALYYGLRVSGAKARDISIGVADGQTASIAIANHYAPVATNNSTPFDWLRVDVIDPWSFAG